MYGDKFYQDFFKNKRFNDFTDSENSNDTSNPADYNAGKNLMLSDEITRCNLALGIQDTGALTNYFLIKGYQGGNLSGTATGPGHASSAKDPTNYDGYLFYNSHLYNPKSNLYGNIKDDVNGKLKPAGLKLVQDKERYGVKGFNLFLLFAKAVGYALLSALGTTAKTFENNKLTILELGEKYKNKNYGDLNNFDKVYIAK